MESRCFKSQQGLRVWDLEGHSISDWALFGEDSSELYLTGLLLLYTHTPTENVMEQN